MKTPKYKTANHGAVTPLNINCSCGGAGRLQEWAEPRKNTLKQCAMVFCDSCTKKTKTYSSKNKAVCEWRKINGSCSEIPNN